MNPLWIVTSRDGPDLACETREQAMEHCAIMAADFPQFAPWNVTEYVPASDLAAAKDERDALRALLREAQRNLRLMTYTTEFNGRITAALAAKGE